MQTFTYTKPDSTREAVQAMTRFSDHKSRFLSSGTTLADPIKPDVKRPERGVIVGALAIAIFVFDSATRLEVTAGVLYVVVVLMAVRICRPRGVAIVAAGCIALTVISHVLAPGNHWESAALLNRLFGALVIVVTTFVVLKTQAAQMVLLRAKSERVASLVTLAELTASIAREIRQPLTGVVTNGDACLRWLDNQPPDLDEAREAARDIIKDGNRANEVTESIRALATGTLPRKVTPNINKAILQAIALARSELQRNGVSLPTRLSSDPPPVMLARPGTDRPMRKAISTEVARPSRSRELCSVSPR